MKISNDDRWWDYYSDQPYVLDKRDKPRITADSVVEFIKTLTTLAAVSPALIWRYFSLQPAPSKTAISDFAGLSVSPNPRYHNQIIELIDELKVKQLLIRIPAWKTDQIEDYINFAQQLRDQKILINILQNRESVTQADQWQTQVKTIINACQTFTDTFQIGNAINRSKWGCHTAADYFLLQQKVEALRSDFPAITILGSSVIDFEPLSTLRTLINRQPFKLDGCASLLYVNRRLSPFNKQFAIFDLEKKIRLIYAILSLSGKCKKKLWITETNWPLLNTRPYTPNSGNPRSTVNENTQAEFLKQYFHIAYQTGMVEKVYWWQLINPGYGLVDSRAKQLRKMPSYHAFKDLLHNGFENSDN